MYERILVPLDGSESAEAILPFAEKVAGPLDAEVILLQAIPASRGGFVVATRVQAECYLGSLADRLASKGIRVQTGVRFGSAPAARRVSTMAACPFRLARMRGVCAPSLVAARTFAPA